MTQLTAYESELLDIIADLISQHCYPPPRIDGSIKGNKIDSGALTANARAMRELAQNERLTILSERGRRIIARWPRKDDEA